MIVTSYLFPSGTYAPARLTALLAALDNDTSKLVIDLSCRRKGSSWFVATDKWQTITDFDVVVVLEGGRVAEMGVPGELMQKRGSLFGELLRAAS